MPECMGGVQPLPHSWQTPAQMMLVTCPRGSQAPVPVRDVTWGFGGVTWGGPLLWVGEAGWVLGSQAAVEPWLCCAPRRRIHPSHAMRDRAAASSLRAGMDPERDPCWSPLVGGGAGTSEGGSLAVTHPSQPPVPLECGDSTPPPIPGGSRGAQQSKRWCRLSTRRA